METLRKKWEQLNKKGLLVRLLYALVSIVLSQFGVCCYYACGLGTDPISVFVDGQHSILGMTYGQISTINNVVLLALILLLGRKYLGIGTVLSVVFGGPLIDYFEGMLTSTFPPETSSFLTKILILAVGCVVFAVGTALYVLLNFGIGPFTFPTLWISERFNLDIKWAQMITDFVFFLTGWLMGGVIGVGSAVGVLLTGPIMSAVMKRIGDWIRKTCGPMWTDRESTNQ